MAMVTVNQTLTGADYEQIAASGESFELTAHSGAVEYAYLVTEPASSVIGHRLYEGQKHTEASAPANCWARAKDGGSAFIVLTHEVA